MILEPLVLTSSVIPHLRVVSSKESRINVNLLFQGQGYALKDNLTGDAVDGLSRRHVIKIFSEFSNCRVSTPYIMLSFTYSRSMSRSIVVVHFAIVLIKVVS